MNYRDLAGAIGGGWAQRLHLVQLPGCATTTPAEAACRKQTPLPSGNSTREQTVTAPLALPASRT
ncbi:hypothetical protein, partial [Streptomyces sp. ME18-1-4]|uniref:hypothetical protein n=1 Tax=Streptomyces sp. ME18-1-4 TaxID=3028685 RepID=UPI0029AD3F3E